MECYTVKSWQGTTRKCICIFNIWHFGILFSCIKRFLYQRAYLQNSLEKEHRKYFREIKLNCNFTALPVTNHVCVTWYTILVFAHFNRCRTSLSNSPSVDFTKILAIALRKKSLKHNILDKTLTYQQVECFASTMA